MSMAVIPKQLKSVGAALDQQVALARRVAEQRTHVGERRGSTRRPRGASRLRLRVDASGTIEMTGRFTLGRARGSALLLQQPRAARPLVLGAEHRDRDLGRVRVRRDAVLVQVLRGLLDLDVAGERRDDRLDDALGAHLLDHLHHVPREHHRRRHDRVPVAEDQRMDALVLEAEADRVHVRDGRLAAGDVHRVARRAERRDELAKRRVEIRRHGLQQLQTVVDAGVRQQHAGAAGAGDDDHVLALGRGQHRHAAREVEQVAQAPGADHARLAEHVVVDLVVAGQRAGVRAGRCRARRRPAGLEHDHRLLLRDALGDLGEGAAVLQVLAVLGDDLACSDPARRRAAGRPRRCRTCCRGRRSPTRPSSPSARSR